jgi:hypothetical protein
MMVINPDSVTTMTIEGQGTGSTSGQGSLNQPNVNDASKPGMQQ